jgi:hypothetical protein
MSLDFNVELQASNSWQARSANALRLTCRAAVILGVALDTPYSYYACGIAAGSGLLAGVIGRRGDPFSFLKS